MPVARPGVDEYEVGGLIAITCDADMDGFITASDARLTLRTAVDLEPLLHVGEYVEPDPPKPQVTRHSFASDVENTISYNDLSDNMHWLVETLGERNWWTGTQNSK